MQVLVSRPGTSGGWQECILNRFVDANPDYPFRFIQFTNLLRLGLVWDFSDTSRRQYFSIKGSLSKQECGAASCFDTAKNWAVEMPSDRFSILELRNPHTTEEVPVSSWRNSCHHQGSQCFANLASIGIQQLPFLPSAVAISSSGRHFRYAVWLGNDNLNHHLPRSAFRTTHL